MKQIFNKTVALFLAFVVLFSTMSFTIDMHFCGNTLVETAIFHKAKGCGMETQNVAKTNKNGFEEYAPPLVKKDFNILYRVFRI